MRSNRIKDNNGCVTIRDKAMSWWQEIATLRHFVAPSHNEKQSTPTTHLTLFSISPSPAHTYTRMRRNRTHMQFFAPNFSLTLLLPSRSEFYLLVKPTFQPPDSTTIHPPLRFSNFIFLFLPTISWFFFFVFWVFFVLVFFLVSFLCLKLHISFISLFFSAFIYLFIYSFFFSFLFFS